MDGHEYRMVQLEKGHAKLRQDMYEGNGKPALTVRMAVAEECLEKITKNLRAITLLLLATFLTGVADLIVRTIK